MKIAKLQLEFQLMAYQGNVQLVVIWRLACHGSRFFSFFQQDLQPSNLIDPVGESSVMDWIGFSGLGPLGFETG